MGIFRGYLFGQGGRDVCVREGGMYEKEGDAYMRWRCV